MDEQTLNTLKFVRGAVSTKNMIPEMRHFVIQDGVVRAFNGMLAIASPIDFHVDCAPKALPLFHAIGNCEDVVSLGMTGANRLRVKSGKFKAFIECVELEGLPHQQPEGEVIEFDGAAMLDAMVKLSPFVGNDASRPWTNGILLRGQSAFATNNVCLIEYWLGVEFPQVINIPMPAVKELVRVGKPPVRGQYTKHSMTFHYEDGRWIRTQLYETDWPDLRKVLDVESAPVAVPEDLFAGLAVVKPFADKDGLVFFKDGSLHTTQEDDLGASYAVEGLHGEGIFNIGMLSLLEPVATMVDFTKYPDPLLFFGDRLRGAIVGRRA